MTKNKKAVNEKSKSLRVLVIHGPNLNLLGQRETGIYGKTTMQEINKEVTKQAGALKVSVEFFQSNHEGEIVDIIGRASKQFDGILINPAAYTHTSVATRDALLASALPAVEVHLSNIYKREEFRHHSMTAPACVGQVAGFGMQSYVLGLQALVHSIRVSKKS